MKQVKITYLAHACFCLEQNGYRTVLDPYADGDVPGLGKLRVEAEAVYCSHGHGDHSAAENVALTAGGAAPYTLTEFTVPHDDAEGAKRGKNTVRIFDFGGLRIAHMGDIGRPLTDSEAATLMDVDCVMVPVGGFFTIDAVQAKVLAETIRAKVVIPMHFRSPLGGYPVIAPVEEFTALVEHVNYCGNTFTLSEDTPAQVLVMRP